MGPSSRLKRQSMLLMVPILAAVIFPVTMIALDCAAAVAYGFAGDWRRCVYWLAAAVLTLCVTV